MINETIIPYTQNWKQTKLPKQNNHYYNDFKSEDFFETKIVSNTYTDKGIIEFQDAVRIVKYDGGADDAYPFINPETESSTLKTIVLPNSITSIGNRALGWCSSLISVTIPNSVTSIGADSFVGCSSLTSIIIPGGVTLIDNHAFNNCSSLTSITFEGTIEQWNAITKGSNWNRNVPATYVQCSDGQVAL